jgi:hypothetical protein
MDYDRSIHNNPDAQAWAKFFIETTKDIDREVFGIEGYMIAWFSNAMMAMHDHLYKTEIAQLREALREIYEVYAGSEGIPQPMTAAEGYLLSLLMEAVEIASKALKEKK